MQVGGLAEDELEDGRKEAPGKRRPMKVGSWLPGGPEDDRKAETEEATLDASWESAAGRAGRCKDRLDCEIVNLPLSLFPSFPLSLSLSTAESASVEKS